MVKKQRTILLVLCLIGLGLGLYFVFPPRSLMRYEDVAQQYLRGLASNDEAAILAILPNEDPRYDAKQARIIVRKKLQQYRGKKLENVKVTFEQGFQPCMVVLTISGTYRENGQAIPFSESAYITRIVGPFWRFYRESWVLMLPEENLYKPISNSKFNNPPTEN
jgi:hypothetical protein